MRQNPALHNPPFFLCPTRYRPVGTMVRKWTVIGFDTGYVRVLGEDKETTVFIVNIDSGWDEWADGKWRERSTSGLR